MRVGVQEIDFGRRSLADYEEVAQAPVRERVRAAAGDLQGARVLHVTSGASGGRVPETLRALLPLLADAGLEPSWHGVFGGGGVGSQLRDGLQGAETAVTDLAEYREELAEVADRLPAADLYVVHDPELLGLEITGAPALWRCHLDISEPEDAAWELAGPLAEGFADRAYSLPAFAPPGERERPAYVEPGIDPLSSKNADLPPAVASKLLRSLGVDLTRPLCCHTATFDRWKDPQGVMDVVGAARESVPELQLVIAGVLEADSPADWNALGEITDYAKGMADVHVLTSYTGLGPAELGALQRVSRVLVQRSLHEGFGLVASEALWKGTPVVAQPEGGIPVQVRDGSEGYLAESTQEAGERLAALVRDPADAIEMGQEGRGRVRERFLITRMAQDELELLAATVRA